MLWVWIGFIAFILLMLSLDLGVFHRHAHVIGMREALGWTAIWVFLGVSFSLFVYFGYEHHWLGLGSTIDAIDGEHNDGLTAAIKYLTGYIVEESLSADNVFVMAILFGYMGVPERYRHRVLFWGILGALVMRGVMIAAGSALIARFHWILYLFGAFLLLTGVRMLFSKDEESDPNENVVVRLTRRWFPVTARFHGERFFVRAGEPLASSAEAPGDGPPEPDEKLDGAPAGKLFLTPLALALVMVETTDLIFAVDSIPAIFAITADPFLLFTSNVFAILGLRSLYFALAGMITKFRYLKTALSLVLVIVGAKMLAAEWLKELLGKAFNLYLLGVVLLILTAGVVSSLLADNLESRRAEG